MLHLDTGYLPISRITGHVRLPRLPGLEDCFRVARDSGSAVRPAGVCLIRGLADHFLEGMGPATFPGRSVSFPGAVSFPGLVGRGRQNGSRRESRQFVPLENVQGLWPDFRDLPDATRNLPVMPGSTWGR